jgi:N6-L-threonylcarbamoyladenine synthase
MLMIVLGIETSCDETGIGLVNDDGSLICNLVVTQMELHSNYGGIIPEIASRQHILTIEKVLNEALSQTGVKWSDIAAVAVTNGPGLAGSLLIGVAVAKGIATTTGLPLIGVNHIEGHIAAAMLKCDSNPDFLDLSRQKPPFACLVVSGGHTEIVIWDGAHQFEIVGQTRDDAAGEAFDKVARALGLGYPGGPAIQKIAAEADDTTLQLPHPVLKQAYDFSFSGLKTATIRLIQKMEPLDSTKRANLANAFQRVVGDVLTSKVINAADEYRCNAILVVGGVAANANLRRQIKNTSKLPVFIPPLALCTDNGAMIAMRGLMLHRAKLHNDLSLDVIPNLVVGCSG